MEFKRKKDFLVCIDSDGCAMDTMNIKHFEAFGPELIKIFNLEKYQDDILEHWNKVNLFSKTRGVNRFIRFLKSLEYANEKYNLNFDLTNYKNYTIKLCCFSIQFNISLFILHIGYNK